MHGCAWIHAARAPTQHGLIITSIPKSKRTRAGMPPGAAPPWTCMDMHGRTGFGSNRRALTPSKLQVGGLPLDCLPTSIPKGPPVQERACAAKRKGPRPFSARAPGPARAPFPPSPLFKSLLEAGDLGPLPGQGAWEQDDGRMSTTAMHCKGPLQVPSSPQPVMRLSDGAL